MIAQVAVTGMKHLEDVLTNHLNTLKATHSANGTVSKASITFSEYIALLIGKAQVHDASNKSKYKGVRSTNVHEQGEDKEDFQPFDFFAGLEANVHTVDTPFSEILVNKSSTARSSNGPAKPIRMDKATCHSLTHQ